jgi:hypothetical protein
VTQSRSVRRLALCALSMVFTLALAPVWGVHAKDPLPMECPDRACLIQASRDCIPAHWTMNLATDSILAQLGYDVTGTGGEEIVRREGDRCIFHIWADYQDVRLSAPAVQQRLAVGRTLEEIEQTLEDYTRQARTQNEGICRFLLPELTVYLEHLNEQYWSTSDYANADCHGTMFD